MKTYTLTEEELEIEKCREVLLSKIEHIEYITADYLSKKYHKKIHELEPFAQFFSFYWAYTGKYFFEKKYNFNTKKYEKVSDDYIKKFEKLVDKKFKEFIKIIEVENYWKDAHNLDYISLYDY